METLYEVSHMPNGWDMETVGRFTDKAKAYRFAHLLALIERSYGGRRIAFVDHFQQSMRASRNLRRVTTNYVLEEKGKIVIQKADY